MLSLKKSANSRVKVRGKKDKDSNPTDGSKLKRGTEKGPNSTRGPSIKKKCNIRSSRNLKRIGSAKDILRRQKYVANKT
jgi:hypothetical protein